MTADAVQDNQQTAIAQLQSDMARMPRPPKRILGNQLVVASYARPDFRVVIQDLTTTVEDVLRPDFWANCGDKLAATIKSHPFALIEVIWGDGSRYMRLIVLDAAQLWAKVKVLENTDLTTAECIEPEAEEPEFYVKRVNPALGFCIIRKSDNEHIKTNIGTKAQAEQEMKDLIKALKS